jgi:hypothetical protein
VSRRKNLHEIAAVNNVATWIGLQKMHGSKVQGIRTRRRTRAANEEDAVARGWATLLLGRLRDFVVVPSSAGGNSSFETGPEGPELGD